MVTVDDVRRVARNLPRTTEHLIHDRVKFRVKQLVYVALSQDETLMGFAFPKEERSALSSHGWQVPVLMLTGVILCSHGSWHPVCGPEAPREASSASATCWLVERHSSSPA